MDSSRRILMTGLWLVAGCAAHGAAPGESRTADDEAGAETQPRWRMVWSDEFDGPAGQLPDADTWTAQVGGDGWGNNQLEFDTDRPENASLDGEGHLVITARRELFGDREYSSARLTTDGKFDRTYGRFEARLQLPTGQGLWPAFWLLGSNIHSVGWPSCGEIDVMENRGQESAVVRGSVHGPEYSGGQNLGRDTSVSGGGLHEGFHDYAVEWTENRIEWSVDGYTYFSVNRADIPGRWVFDHPHHILLNVAVGGNYVGPPDASTVFPQRMIVDHVRVYEREP